MYFKKCMKRTFSNYSSVFAVLFIRVQINFLPHIIRGQKLKVLFNEFGMTDYVNI